MTHTGQPIIERFSERRVTILCPHRHVIDSIPLAEWSHSREEARYGPGSVVTCNGALSTD